MKRELVLAVTWVELVLAVTWVVFTFSLELQASDERRNYVRLDLTGVVGPESLAFDDKGGGPYTGVSDGRILRWTGDNWTQFAIASPHWREECYDSTNTRIEDVCGRPLGLQFNQATGDLYIADAYYGLLAVGSGGGLATPIASQADGEPFGFTNGLDIDQETGVVYFTDTSTLFRRRDYMMAVISMDKTGRLMKYDPESKHVSVLLRGLAFPNGVAINKDRTFLLVIETTFCRILRFWLQGPLAGTAEVFMQLPGYPDNIKTNARGEFWVALNVGNGGLRRSSLLNSTEMPRRYQTLESMINGVAMRLDQDGNTLEVLEDNDSRIMQSVSEVEENNGCLWIGSVVMPYVGMYRL